MAKRDSVVDSTVAQLRQLIATQYQIGDRLPNEKQLAEGLDVSRGSVREALGTLAAEGAVTRTWGVGTFVSVPRSTSSLSMAAIESYRERVRAAGHEVALLRAHCELANPEPMAARALRTGPDEQVWRVERLFAVDGVPSALMIEHIPTTIGGVTIDPSAMTSLESGLFDMLDAHIPGIVTHTSTEVEAVAARELEAADLRIAVGAPVLRTEQFTLSDDDTCLAHGVTVQHTDVLRMRIVR
ncbi:GntR family transcriptional regulator [Microbacterium sp. zg-YB36]|uniref:GntR family transcriptional regulator n=1 Tax=Microbacterium sp. zg-YB36 TaxID=2969407 RepID=UPI00214B3AAD|nr:GntR family transcriptional regulator [Microbacterium sp. zg-YB36]MDL5351992.1 GntR family transcriptional regulator [Microbacterium sp. zg-YB36]